MSYPNKLKINIWRFDGGLRVCPCPPYVEDKLFYFRRGMEMKGYKKETTFTKTLLCQPDGEGGVYTLQGFFQTVVKAIEDDGDEYIVHDTRTPMGDIDWERIKRIGLRDYQIEPTVDLLVKAQQENGLIIATGGYGKTYAQAAAYAAWHDKHTILAIPLQEVVKQTAKDFQRLFPEKHVGIVGAGFHDVSNDITICTYQSLKLCALEKCEMLLMDEVQSSTGDKIQEILGTFTPQKVLGFTATPDGLFNNADKVITGIFGEKLLNIDYEEAEDMNAVVPLKCYFIKVPFEMGTDFGNSFDTKLKRGIKRYTPRNKLVGEVLTKIPADWQSITFVDHVEDHLVEVFKHMPVGSKYIHRCSDKKKMGQFAMTPKQQDVVVADFKAYKFRHLLATDAFRAGVSVNNVRLVLQTAGGCSKVELLQEAYRCSRILTDDLRTAFGVSPKTHGIIVDFWDDHDDLLNGMARKRMKIYQSQGWTCEIIDDPSEIDWVSIP